jgi:hypothetical protein
VNGSNAHASVNLRVISTALSPHAHEDFPVVFIAVVAELDGADIAGAIGAAHDKAGLAACFLGHFDDCFPVRITALSFHARTLAPSIGHSPTDRGSARAMFQDEGVNVKREHPQHQRAQDFETEKQRAFLANHRLLSEWFSVMKASKPSFTGCASKCGNNPQKFGEQRANTWNKSEFSTFGRLSTNFPTIDWAEKRQ